MLERLLADNPPMHMQGDELTNTWSIQADTLRYLHDLLSSDMTTLETGCGQSTLVFAIANTRHICITPDSSEAERVSRYCRQLGLASRVTFSIGSSDQLLPATQFDVDTFDLVLIDGAHGFPYPAIDFHYAGRRLSIGGILALDDYKMPSVRMLYDFLLSENEWEFMSIIQNTAFFRKLGEPVCWGDWGTQQINASYPGF